MPESSPFQDLDANVATLDRNLRRDNQRVAPDEEASERPGDIVFFADDTWQRILVELAYLRNGETAMQIGLNRFVQEARNDLALRKFNAGLNALSDIVERGHADPSDDLFAVDDLLEALADTLSFASGNEGDQISDHLPGIGEVSVWSRIVQSRLDRLGTLLDTAVGQPWGEEEILSLRRLNRLLGGTSHAVTATQTNELLQLCGNADEMVARLRARDPGGFLVAKSGPFPGSRDTFYRRLGVGADRFFSTAPLINFAPALRRIGTGKSTVHRIAMPIHNDADAALADPSNKLGLRLVQIKLWQRGHYDDSIDAIVGPNTISGLLEALEIYGNSTLSEVRLDILRRLGDGQIAINLHGLDKLVFSAANEVDLSRPERAEIVAEAATQIVEQRAAEVPSSNTPFSDAPPMREDALAARRGLLGGIGHKARGLFRTAGQALRSLAAAVKRGVHNMVIAVDRMLSPVRVAIGVAFSQIDKVRALLALAVRAWRTFVCREPLTIGNQEEGFVSVQFALDQDVRICLFNDPSERALKAYRKASGRLYRMIRLSLYAAVTTINLLRAVATWPGRIRLVLELTSLLKKQLTKPILLDLT